MDGRWAWHRDEDSGLGRDADGRPDSGIEAEAGASEWWSNPPGIVEEQEHGESPTEVGDEEVGAHVEGHGDIVPEVQRNPSLFVEDIESSERGKPFTSISMRNTHSRE